MLKVSEILRVKGNTLYTATSDTLVLQAIETMSEQDIGSLVIMDRGELMRMVTFRELIRLLHAKQGNTGENTVRGIMNDAPLSRSEEHTSELQSLMRTSYAVFCLKKKKT